MAEERKIGHDEAYRRLDEDEARWASGLSQRDRELRAKMTELATSFPNFSDRELPGIDPWYAPKLDYFVANDNFLSYGETLAAQFLLAAWNPYTKWMSGRFDAIDSAWTWGTEFKQIFIQWFEDPLRF